MCGSFTQSYTWRELAAPYRLTQPARNLQSPLQYRADNGDRCCEMVVSLFEI